MPVTRRAAKSQATKTPPKGKPVAESSRSGSAASTGKRNKVIPIKNSAKALPKKQLAIQKKVTKKPTRKKQANDEDPDSEDDDVRLSAYLKKRESAAVAEFRKCIADMKKHKATEVIATDHPSYDLHLHIAGHNAPKKKVQIYSPKCGDGSFDDFTWSHLTHPFFVQCWAKADGKNSGCRFIVFDNGIGTMKDLNTGTPPPEDSVTVKF